MAQLKLPTRQAVALEALKVDMAFAAAGTEETGEDDRSDQIDKIESLWGLIAKSYCAMGLIYCYLKAIAALTGRSADLTTLKFILLNELSYYFHASTMCHVMVANARMEGRFINLSHAQPGDPVFFDWDGDGAPDHVEMFIKFLPPDKMGRPRFQTVGWNTTSDTGQGTKGCYVKSRPRSLCLGAYSINVPPSP